MLRKILRLALIGGLTALAGLLIYPYHDGALRIGLPLSLFAIWFALLALLWERPWRWPLLALPVAAAVPFCLPSKPCDRAELRQGYVTAMARMEGTRYVWGGESRRGIDCSGLPRRGLRDALLEQGWHHGNGAAFREWARQWWFDTSAKALGEGYRGVTYPLDFSGKLRGLDFAQLQPGDLAVTADGRHVMVFFGGTSWIQADPGQGRVVVAPVEADSNPWLDAEVSLHRWSVLR